MCKDLEGNWEQLEDVKNNRGKPMSDKDIQKLEKTCRKLEESLVRADREYRDTNIRTEEARLAWESAMYRCCRVSPRNYHHNHFSKKTHDTMQKYIHVYIKGS